MSTFGDHVHDTVVANEAERTRRRVEELELQVARYERFLRALAEDAVPVAITADTNANDAVLNCHPHSQMEFLD